MDGQIFWMEKVLQTFEIDIDKTDYARIADYTPYNPVCYRNLAKTLGSLRLTRNGRLFKEGVIVRHPSLVDGRFAVVKNVMISRTEFNEMKIAIRVAFAHKNCNAMVENLGFTTKFCTSVLEIIKKVSYDLIVKFADFCEKDQIRHMKENKKISNMNFMSGIRTYVSNQTQIQGMSNEDLGIIERNDRDDAEEAEDFFDIFNRDNMNVYHWTEANENFDILYAADVYLTEDPKDSAEKNKEEIKKRRSRKHDHREFAGNEENQGVNGPVTQRSYVYMSNEENERMISRLGADERTHWRTQSILDELTNDEREHEGVAIVEAMSILNFGPNYNSN